MSEKATQARALFLGGFNCAQAVLSAFSEDRGLPKIEALRVSGAFGAGMGRMGKVCGAVTGAFMTVGLVSAKTTEEENDLRDEGYRLVQEFTKKFSALHGSIDCRELIGVDLNTAEGKAKAKAEKILQTRCPKFVEDAVTILEEILPK